VRYVYGISTAVLLAGSALTLTTGFPAGAQTAVNENLPAPASVPRAGAPMSFADLTEQLQPAVVNISTKQRVTVNRRSPFAGTPFENFFGGGEGGNGGATTRQAQSLGSGFIISPDGYIVTNNHVISAGNQNATVESITVTMPDRTEYEATLVGKDPDSDLAVLKINARSDLPFVRFGDSEAARVGDWVIAIGNPFGLGGTVTTGIVSAINRNTGQGGAYDSFIQTDASINSGNSGGPMFDLNGNVIGINNAIISPTGGNVGIGFAIPAEVAAPIVAKLRAGQSIERGYLGVQISPMNEDLADSLGVDKNRGEFVERVEPGEAAEKAGLKAGDVVVKVNGLDVTPDRNLSSIVANAGVGQNVPIELIRDGKRIKLNAVLGRRPSQEEFAQRFNEEAQEDFSDQDETMNAQAAQKALGLAVANITPNIARQIGVPSGQQGVVVLAVDPNSDVAQKGIRRGDVLTSINRRPVSKPEDVEAVVSEAQKSGRDAVLLQVKRRTADPRFVPVRLKEG
jgi:serine protease Do